MVEVGAYTTRSDAELAQAALTVAGIPSILEADDVGDVDPLDLTWTARLLVAHENADEAARVLARKSELQSPEQGTSEGINERGHS